MSKKDQEGTRRQHLYRPAEKEEREGRDERRERRDKGKREESLMRALREPRGVPWGVLGDLPGVGEGGFVWFFLAKTILLLFRCHVRF